MVVEGLEQAMAAARDLARRKREEVSVLYAGYGLFTVKMTWTLLNSEAAQDCAYLAPAPAVPDGEARPNY